MEDTMKLISEAISTPQKNSLYVKTENHNTIKSIVKSKMFFPVFLSGLSGNGKTLSVQQVCAELDRKLVRVNITSETDEDDLIGGFRLVNGETVWFDGPVVKAMKEGAILLLDEVDLGTNKILCLQGVLEGNGIFIKKIGETVLPAEGFNVIATANTKGQGDDTGRYSGTNFLNEAFLERFPVWLDQEYPTTKLEKKILENAVKVFGIADIERYGNVIEALVAWSDQIRKAYIEEAYTELITTRRLVHIIQALQITKDPVAAINLCLSKFSKETQESFLIVFDQFYLPFEESSDENVLGEFENAMQLKKDTDTGDIEKWITD